MAIRSRVVAVGTSPVDLLSLDADLWPEYRDVAIQNTGSVVVYIGGPDVTTTNGFALGVGALMSFDQLGPGSRPYAIAASATTLSVLESGV